MDFLKLKKSVLVFKLLVKFGNTVCYSLSQIYTKQELNFNTIKNKTLDTLKWFDLRRRGNELVEIIKCSEMIYGSFDL